jgi:MFS transporter, DHA2 family, multidrug resistance protein
MSETGVVRHRSVITASVMLAMFVQTLDSTICIVALPYMQGSLSASAEEISWVLTSYVIASAIMTAPVAWMAQRFGRKQVFMASICGFLCMSVLSGLSRTLEQLIICRLIQGMFGAALAPLCQATMLDIYPFTQRAQAMAIFAVGILMGPFLGPMVGGYLTDAYHWRLVFFVTLGPGLLALLGVAIFLPRVPPRTSLRFSWYGFAMLGLAVGMFQLVLDRGQKQDWFTSTEIIAEAVISGLCLYLFVVHMLTADRPFLSPALFKDRNFSAGIIMVACVSSVMLATASLLVPYLQQLGGYPVLDSGIAMAPRGLGTMIAMFLASRLTMRFDERMIMAAGLLAMGWTMLVMSTWTPDVTQTEMMTVLTAQGFAMGLVLNPMTVMAYTTLAAHLRPEAASVQSLARNLGSAVGISVTTFTLSRSTQATHADIVAGITPFRRALPGGDVATHVLDPATRHGAAILDQMVTYQAKIIAYNNDFRLMALTVVPPLILLFFLRRRARVA